MTTDKYVWHRIVTGIVDFTLLGYFLISPAEKMKEFFAENPDLEVYGKLGPRYFTIWNLFIQMAYIILALACDLSSVANVTGPVAERLRKFRCRCVFNAIVPLSLVMLTFWAYYVIDPDLMIPLKLNSVTPFSQHVMFHGGVIIYALLEIIFLPQDVKKKETSELFIYCISVVYVSMIYYTKYVDLGVWIYNVMTYNEESLMLYFPIVFPIVTALMAYHSQWYIKDAFWLNKSVMTKGGSANDIVNTNKN